MNDVSVTSSNLRSIGYDHDTQTLEVEFKTGSRYRYSGVPVAVHDALMGASSHGSYFASHIKDRYPTQKL